MAVSVNDLVQQVARQIGSIAKDNQVQVTLRLDLHIPPSVAVPLPLAHVFLNIGLNAIQHMAKKKPRGG